MTQGVLLFASNNAQVDYVKQAVYCASRIKKYLNLPVSIVTENSSYLASAYPENTFDKIIPVPKTSTDQQRRYFDGVYATKTLEWKNHSRSDCFDLTPYDETIVMDTDYIISNDKLLSAFDYNENFLIYKKYTDLAPNRNTSSLKVVSDRSIDMWWATVFYFKKNDETKFFFDLVKHIKDNWGFYRLTYQIANRNFRNDFAFSIAIHILNGYQNTDWPKSLPGNMYLTTDLDQLISIDNDTMTFLVDENETGKYLAVKTKGANVHVMNKFSLGRFIDEEMHNG